MYTRLRNLWQLLRASFWFVPMLMAASAAGLAFATLELDHRAGLGWQGRGWTWTGGPEGARELLATIASSMITVAGVVFSITIVSLQLASSQYGPHLLRNFMRDAVNQIVLGTFVATFIYCLLVLRAVRSLEGEVFVPHLSVTVGALLALASLAVLIYFIHHVADTIQADNLAAATARDLRQIIQSLFPQELGDNPVPEKAQPPPALPPNFDQETRAVAAQCNGYLQAIESETLMATARAHDLVLRLLRRPGDFIIEGDTLLRMWPSSRCTLAIMRKICSAFIIGRHQTRTQDVEYSAHQLVEIAVRALSPGINDPFTAINCVDWLGASLRQLAQRHIPSRYRYDTDKRLRVIAPTTDFSDLADIAFNQIRQYGARSVPVMLRILETIARLAHQVRRLDDLQALRRHAHLIWEDCRHGIENERDREKLERLYERVLAALAARADGRPTTDDGAGSDASDRS